MIKRRIVGFLCAAIVMGMMAGCSGKSQTENTTAAQTQENKQEDRAKTEESEQEPVTLRFCWWGNEDRHKSTVAALDLYMEEHPNVTIVSEFLGWDGYLEKLTAQLMSGTSPDIMQIDPAWVMQFWQMEDRFVDMSKQDIIDMSIFDDYSGIIKTFTSPTGVVIGIPTGLNFTVLYVNGELADKIGLDLSRPFTWDRIVEYGKKVQEYDNNMYLLSSNEIGVEFYFFNTYLLNHCGDYMVKDDFTLGFDYEDALATFTFMKGLYDQKIIAPFEDMITVQSLWEVPGLLDGTIVAAQQQSSNVNVASDALADCQFCVPVGD